MDSHRMAAPEITLSWRALAEQAYQLMTPITDNIHRHVPKTPAALHTHVRASRGHQCIQAPSSICIFPLEKLLGII